MSTPEPEDDSDAIERISDPDDYNLRRRLRQLHDAKDRVVDMKDRCIRLEETDREFTPTQRDRFVAEAVTDYINELRGVLARQDRETEFLDEDVATIQVDGTGDVPVTIRSIVESRGSIGENGTHAPIPYQVSMDAWAVCNRYFEDIAGVKFDDAPGPEANPIDPAGRFTDE